MELRRSFPEVVCDLRQVADPFAAGALSRTTRGVDSVLLLLRVYAVYNMYADRSVLYEGVVKSLFVVIILYIFIVIITVKFHPRAIQYNILCTPPRAYILKFKK